MVSIKQICGRYAYSVILLKQLVRTDFKLRYQGSFLGYIWSLLRPLLIFVILYLVFTVFLPVGKGVPHYPVYLLLGIVLWNYFTEVTSGGVSAIVGKGELLRKINFPKYVVIFAGSFSALINLALNGVIIVIFMILGHVDVSWKALLLIPLILELFVVSIAVAFFVSTLFVRFRDISYIWEVILQAGFYATPILYPLSRISDSHPKAAKFLILNPMAQIIQDARYVLVTPDAATINQVYKGQDGYWTIPIVLVVLIALLATAYFRRRSKFFAEEV